ncbi:hypothetical protein [Pectinatus haikarae]|uniref:hypothetical protein n=1 Tax=Pectinatus haikarae TaxID=349096 RepID=UPI0018C72E36|nr:hypothetical protein [Pectinatus haikarae]
MIDFHKLFDKKQIPMILLIFIILSMHSILIQGCVVNDALLHYINREHGLLNVIYQQFLIDLNQGRPLRLAVINWAFDNISKNFYISRFIQIGILISNLFLFGYFLKRIFNNIYFSYLVIFLFCLFLPITFEHALPNVYIGLVGMPINYLLLSLIFFDKYFDNRKRYRLFIVSMFFWFLAVLSFEFMVTFVCLFPIINKYKTGRWIGINKITIIPVLIVFWYITTWIILTKIYISHYSGTQIDNIWSAKNHIDILYQLFKSSLPGYFIFNDKYAYIYKLCGDIIPSNDDSSLVSRIQSIILNMGNIKIILEAIVAIIIFFKYYYFLKDDENNSMRFSLKYIIVAIVYLFLPALPYAIARMYQGRVNATDYISLTASYPIYFSMIFLFSYIIWHIIKKLKIGYIKIILMLLICFYGMLIQTMNNTFAIEQQSIFSRITNIESLFETRALRNITEKSICSFDLYQTQMSLSVSQKNLNDLVKLHGCNFTIENYNDNNKITLWLIVK